MAIRNVDDDDNDDDGVDDKCIFMCVELNNRMNELSYVYLFEVKDNNKKNSVCVWWRHIAI